MSTYPNQIDFLKNMEKVLRTSPRKNNLTGLFIEIGNDTATNWVTFLREIIADQEMPDIPESKP